MVCQVKSLVPVIGDTGFALAPDQTSAQVSYTQFGFTNVESALSTLYLDKLQDVGLTTTYDVGSVSITPNVLKLQALGFVVGAGSANIATATTTTVGLMSPAQVVKLDALTANYKSHFNTLALLQAAHPTALDGDWAIVRNPVGPAQHYSWDSNSSSWEAVDYTAITGTTNLSYVPSPTNGVVSSDTGADAAIPVADATNAGLLTPSEKTKLASARKTQEAPLTLYVRTNGNDLNDGLTNDAAGAFLTIQAAANALGGMDLKTNDATIRVATGTYNSGVTLPKVLTTGVCSLVGNNIAPANVIINDQVNDAITGQFSGKWLLNGFTVVSAKTGVRAQAGTSFNTFNMVFGVCNTHVSAEDGGVIRVGSNYDISGSALYHYKLLSYGTIWCVSKVITLTPGLTFNTFLLNQAAAANIYTSTYTDLGPVATGKKFHVALNGTINAAGVILPGDVAGTTISGGVLG